MVSPPDSDIAHDAKVVALIGARADVVMAAPVAYPALRADVIGVALAAGKTCRVKAASARILIYAEGEEICAVATELRHSGYRRAYKLHRALTVEALVAHLVGEYI